MVALINETVFYVLDVEPGWRSQHTTRLRPGRPTNPNLIPGRLRDFSPAKCPDGIRGPSSLQFIVQG